MIVCAVSWIIFLQAHGFAYFLTLPHPLSDLRFELEQFPLHGPCGGLHTSLSLFISGSLGISALACRLAAVSADPALAAFVKSDYAAWVEAFGSLPATAHVHIKVRLVVYF